MKRFVAIIIVLTALIFSGNTCMAEPSGQASSGWNHFVWGAEVGGATDLTSNNLSSINLDAFFGYKDKWLNAVGIGASVNMMVSNSVRSFPVYAILRTDFSADDKLLFMDLRGGIAINQPSFGTRQTGLYLAPGVGINLYTGRTFRSYFTLSYIYNGMKPFDLGDRHCDVDGLSMACLRIGISF